jgi:hypothetical protein
VCTVLLSFCTATDKSDVDLKKSKSRPGGNVVKVLEVVSLITRCVFLACGVCVREESHHA